MLMWGAEGHHAGAQSAQTDTESEAKTPGENFGTTAEAIVIFKKPVQLYELK